MGGRWMVVVIGSFLVMMGARTLMVPAQQSGTSPLVAAFTATTDLPRLAVDDFRLTGTSGLTAERIDQILASYGSPAVGSGQWFVRYEQEYAIDAAYALAFFIHESSAGTNPSWAGRISATQTTHNIGNIICAGYPTCYGRFRSYPSWKEGIEDWYRLIAREYREGRGIATIMDVIPIYAPAVENNVAAYQSVVRTLVNQWRSQ